MFNSFPIPKPDSGGSNIKSIQRGQASFTGSETSITVTISAIDPNASIALVNYILANSADTDCVDITITNSTTLTLTRWASNTSPMTVEWFVEEYNNVKSIQNGSLTPSSASQNVTVTSTNITKSKLVASWRNTGSFSTASYYLCRYKIVDSTTINFNETSGIHSNFRILWRLIEFN